MSISQAQLRRERREKKIREGATDRLSKITGKPVEAVESLCVDADDPPEIDISDMSHPPINAGINPFPQESAWNIMNDPFSLLDQKSASEGFGSMNLNSLQFLNSMGNGNGAASNAGMKINTPATRQINSDYWRLAHSLLIFIGSVVVVYLQFKVPIFYFLVGLELLWQSTRLLQEKGKCPSGSILSSIAMYLPPPFSTYLMLIARYSIIWVDFVDSVCMAVFTLGMYSLF